MALVTLDTAGDGNEPFRLFGTVPTFSPGSDELRTLARKCKIIHRVWWTQQMTSVFCPVSPPH